MHISSRQARAARAHLGYTFQEIEDKIGIKLTSNRRFEKEKGDLSKENHIALRTFYERAGIEFIAHDGIRRPKSTITTLEGQREFILFMKDVANTVEQSKGDICVSGVDERLFEKWQGDYAETHLARMAQLQTLNNTMSRIILKEGDHYYTAAKYAEYRHIEGSHFTSTPFYVYGDKLAMISFEEDDVTVQIIHNEKLAHAQRQQFNALWDSLKK